MRLRIHCNPLICLFRLLLYHPTKVRSLKEIRLGFVKHVLLITLYDSVIHAGVSLLLLMRIDNVDVIVHHGPAGDCFTVVTHPPINADPMVGAFSGFTTYGGQKGGLASIGLRLSIMVCNQDIVECDAAGSALDWDALTTNG
eukprot:1156_1